MFMTASEGAIMVPRRSSFLVAAAAMQGASMRKSPSQSVFFPIVRGVIDRRSHGEPLAATFMKE
jgi:hypothetical protein